MPRRKSRAAPSPAARKSPRAAVQAQAKAFAAESTTGSPGSSRSRSTSASSRGGKTSPAPSPSTSGRTPRRSRGGKADEPVEEVQTPESTPRGRSSRKSAAPKEAVATPSPRGSGRLTRGQLQEEVVKKATPKKGGRSRSRGKAKQEEEEEKVQDEEEDEEEETPAPPKTTPAPPKTTPAPLKTTPAPLKTTPAPPKTTPARSGRGRSKQVDDEPPAVEHPIEDEEKTEESEAPQGRRSRGRATPAKTPPQKSTPTGRRSQSRQKTSPVKEEEPAAEAVEEKVTPKGRRATKSPAPKTPPSRSRRGKAKQEEEPKAAEVEDVVDDKEKEPEVSVEQEDVTGAEASSAADQEQQDREDVEEKAPSGIETPPEEPTVAKVVEAAEEHEMEVQESDSAPSTAPTIAPSSAPELSKPSEIKDIKMEPEVVAAPVTSENVDQLSPPSEAPNPSVDEAIPVSTVAASPVQEISQVEKTPSVLESKVEVSPPPKEPEPVSTAADKCVLTSPEVISISPPPEAVANNQSGSNNSVEVVNVAQEMPIVTDEEPVLSTRKRSHEETECDEDLEDLNSKKAKIITPTEQESTFENVLPVTLSNGSGQETKIVNPVSQQVEPDIVEIAVVEAMEVGQASGEGDFSVPRPEKPEVQEAKAPEVEDSNTNASKEDDILKEYVVIEMSDVPNAKSEPVQNAVPKQVQLSSKTQPSTDTQITDGSSTNHVSQNVPSSDPLLNRLFVPNPSVPSDSVSTEKQFSVVSYNILAQCWMKKYSSSYSYVPPSVWDQSFRHNRLMEELVYLASDIVCLQEVEATYYEKTLRQAMDSNGYDGVYQSRQADEGFKEGEAIFFKRNRFTLLQSEAKFLKDLAEKEIETSPLAADIRASVRNYLDLPDVVVVASLQCKKSENVVTVGNVHVNYGDFLKPNVQCIQISSAVKELVSYANNGNNPHIICGDFNSSPDTPGYQLARDGYLSDDMIQKLQSSANMDMPDGSKSALVNHLWGAFQHTSSTIKSAYATTQGSEPACTSVVDDCIKHCLDYIFYSSGSLDTLGVLQVASMAVITANKALPSTVFPSDHLSLKTVLSFK